MYLSIIIPCYNEAENIPGLIDGLLPVLQKLSIGEISTIPHAEIIEVVFIDDSSEDNTFKMLQESIENLDTQTIMYRIERHNGNQGLGAALRTGFNVSRGDVVVTIDSDGTYKFDEIPNLLSCLNPGVDIVTASPYHPDGKVDSVPPTRLLLSRGSSFVYRILLDNTVHTYTSLFRAYRSRVIKEISFQSDGYLAGTELMVRAMLQGYRVAEYPTILYQRKYGVSKAKIAKTIAAHLRFQAHLLLHQLRISKLIGSNPDLID